MHPVQYDRERRDVVQQLLEVLDRLLFGHLQTELAEHLLVHVALLDVRDVGVDHERDQVEDEVRALPEDRKGREAKRLEALPIQRKLWGSPGKFDVTLRHYRR